MLAELAGSRVAVRTLASSWVLSLFVLVILLFPSELAFAAEDTFQPPKAYPAERYEAGWNMNPFTLKTAPVALAKASFAADLAIGSYFGSKDNPTVVVVNTKTGERTSLKIGEAASNGMKLKTVTLKPSRKDVVAEVALAEESAVLHFSDSYLRQVTASGDQATAHDAQAASGEKPPGSGPPAGQPPDPRRPPPRGSAAQQFLTTSSGARNPAISNAAIPNARENPAGLSSKGAPSSTIRRLQTAPVRPVDQSKR